MFRIKLTSISSQSSPCLRLHRARKDAGRSLATAAPTGHGLNVHDVVHGFRLEKVKQVPEFDLTALQLRHEKTGAQYVHILKDDPNNVFCVSFKTPPRDSTGVPHILEHTTLCGSEKYPVRDPFFKMLNRSLSTFMNAMTGSDITMYPFSTENNVDYYNLMNVYMDSVFSPRLDAFDFKQEGWRLEHENPLDPTTPIIFKGIVYNEMKGALSDPGSLFLTRLLQHLYPNTTYSQVSGGDPENITDLTHAQLVDFHTRHYHPANAVFFSYGNFELQEHLRRVDERIRGIPPAGSPPNEVGELTVFDKPKRVVLPCAPDAMGNPEKQTKMSISYLTNDETDVFESFAVRVLTSLLLDGAASPMYRALIESNIGSDYAASTGYDNTSRRTSVSFGLQGLKSDDVPLVEQKIREVLEAAAKDGFDPLRVESVVHQLELSLRHRNTNFGMMLAQSVSRVWVHEGDVLESLEVTKHIKTIRNELARTGNRFFQERVERYFLKNPHVLTFVMEPSDSYVADLAAAEQKRLAKHIGSLSAVDLKKVAEDGKVLLQNQETKQDLSCLPTLTVNDIAKTGKIFTVDEIDLTAGATRDPKGANLSPGLPLQWRSTASNGVSYIKIASNALGTLPQDLLVYVPLFCAALPSLGTKKRSLAELDEAARLLTNGFHASVSASNGPHSLFAGSNTSFSVSTSCLHSASGDTSVTVDTARLAKVYDLLGEVLIETDWDGPESSERLKTVVLGLASSGMNSLADSGHLFAMLAAQSAERFGPTPTARGQEVLDGLTQVGFVNGLAESLSQAGEDGLLAVTEKLKAIAKHIIEAPTHVRAAVNATENARTAHVKALQNTMTGLGWLRPGLSGVSPFTLPPNADLGIPASRVSKNSKKIFPLPFQVNFTAKTFLGVNYTHPDGAGLQVLAKLMTAHYLHRELREKGGAYGGGARYSPLDGMFSMFSYRDPPSGLPRTLETYERAVEWATDVSKHVTQQELDEAKLSLFSQLDTPINASAEGMIRFRHGITDEMQQRRRELLLGTTLKNVQEVAQAYLAAANTTSSIAVLGDAEETGKVVAAQGSEWEVVQQ